MLLDGPIIAYQGEIFSGIIRFPSGPAIQGSLLVDGSGNYRIDFSEDHCLEKGDCIHVMGSDACCTLHSASYEITSLDSNGLSAAISLFQGNPPAGSIENIQIAKAMNLQGFSLVGAVATRNPNVSPPPGIYGSIAKGSNQVLLTASVDSISQGDLFSMPSVGINGAIVTGVYRFASSQASTPFLASSGYSSSGCGCSGVVDSPSETEKASSAPEKLVVTLNQTAASSVTATNPASIQVKGRKIAAFEFDMTSAECGVVSYKLDLRRLAGIQLPSSSCDAPPCRIGCYQVALIRGTLPNHGNYPSGNYYDWMQIIGSGDVALKPLFLDLLLEF